MTLQDVLYEYRYWIFGIAVVFVLGASALIRSNWLLRQRTLLLVENNRELDFQNLALDEHAIVSTVDVKGNITYVNDKFCEISGYSREELLGQNHRLLKSKKHSDEFYKNLWRTIDNGKPWHGEIENIKKDGGYYWVEASIVPILNKQGKPVEYVGIRTDITAQKDAEREKNSTAEREINRFKTTLDLTADEVTMFWSDTLEFFYVNQAVVDKSGSTAETFFGLTPEVFNPRFDKVRFRELSKPLIYGTKKFITFETTFVEHSGKLIPREVLLQLTETEGERPYFVAVARDISERKEAERSIRQFKATLDLSQDRIHMFWPDTLKFFYANQSALKHAGCSEEEFYNMTPLDINPTLDEEEFREAISELICGDQKAIIYEAAHPNALGELMPVEVLRQYLLPVGEKPRFVSVIRDVSERKVAEKAKSEFISTVSHELRTPLTSIKGALGLIKAGALDDNSDKLHSMINIAHSNSEHLALLIDDILDLEKLEAGMMRFRMEPTDIAALLEEAVMANKGYGDEYEVTFACFGTNNPLFANVDKDRLMQVMANLLSNATKFSPRYGEVEVSLIRRDGDIRIAVKDYGSGIPEGARETIFEKFTQADSSDQRQRGGTGLGLSIVKMIVEGHGGRVGFTSKVDKGTTFTVDLPEVETKRKQQTFETEK